MKNYLYFLVIGSILISCSCPEPKTFIPDNGLELLLIEQGYDNVQDDYVLTSSIDTITKLSIHGDDYHILDFTGIEDFKALAEFILSEQILIKQINLSHNKELRKISLGDVWKLESIDVTGATNLEEFDIYYGSSLLNLNLRFNTSLKSVSAIRCSKLIRFDIKNGSNNLIENFTSGENDVLECIRVDDEIYSNSSPNWTIIPGEISTFANDCGYIGI